MANEIRVRQNFLGGKVDDNPLTSGATTLTSSALAAMVAIGSTQHLPIVLDPDGIFGAPEIAYVTAHSASATTATILRAQEGTTARAHQQDVDWVHAPTTTDFALTGTMLPAWTAPSFQNSWADFASGATYAAGYYLDPSGVVHLRGLITGGATNTVAFTLPAGYRPQYSHNSLVLHYVNTNTPAMAWVQVSAAGVVTIVGSTGSFSGTYGISLDDVTFRQYQ
jgi:hypothetical protein